MEFCWISQSSSISAQWKAPAIDSFLLDAFVLLHLQRFDKPERRNLHGKEGDSFLSNLSGIQSIFYLSNRFFFFQSGWFKILMAEQQYEGLRQQLHNSFIKLRLR